MTSPGFIGCAGCNCVLREEDGPLCEACQESGSVVATIRAGPLASTDVTPEMAAELQAKVEEAEKRAAKDAEPAKE